MNSTDILKLWDPCYDLKVALNKKKPYMGIFSVVTGVSCEFCLIQLSSFVLLRLSCLFICFGELF